MKITGTSNDAKKFVDRIEPGTAVGKLDVGEDQPGLLRLRQRQRLGVSARDADDIVAEAFDQRLDVHGDEGLVLDDEDVGGDLGGEFAAGFLDQTAQRRQVAVENFGRFLLGEAFERHQQEGLAGPRRDLGQVLLGRQGRVAAGRTCR